MKYIGYVYIWFDTKEKLFYVGGHRGSIEDSYICSNPTMFMAYLQRPETFRFRVLEHVYGNLTNLRESEKRWLGFIKPKELFTVGNLKTNTVRYYNQKKHSTGGNGHANKGKIPWNKGLSKATDTRVLQYAEKVSQTMRKR